MNHSALIIDDDRTSRRLLAMLLKDRMALSVVEAQNGVEGLRILARDAKHIKLAVLDLEMPEMGGLETLKIIGRDYAHLPVIILTGSKNMDDAVHAMKSGASDFLCKPIDRERFLASARNALRLSIMGDELTRLRSQISGELKFCDLIGYQGGLKDCIKTARKAAQCSLPVFITGETGTGKDVFARAIHGESKRSGKPFVAVNCGAIPEKLIESTLFGHEKGAFTGAASKSQGKFREAHGGTLFLDEIGELPSEGQVKLLRAIQQGEIEPVGAGKPVPVDVRIISATNKDIFHAMREENFREDLYFRLNVIAIDLPPLRERTQDIPLLAQSFAEKFCFTHGIPPKHFPDAALESLQHHSWNGNVRELENAIGRALALADGDDIDPMPFVQASARIKGADRNVISPIGADGQFKRFGAIEQEIIALALAHHGHNISKTARVLGIAKSTLYTKIQSFSMSKSA